MDERKWIERILAGDTQSFSCLVAKYEKMAYTIAFRILENREEAEEAVQDAFVKMYRALSDFHFDSKFSTWFYRIVGMMLDSAFTYDSDWFFLLVPAITIMFGGVAFIIYFFLSRSLMEKERLEDEKKMRLEE